MLNRVLAVAPHKKNLSKTLPPAQKKCIFIYMKKLFFVLALALMLAPSAFAERRKSNLESVDSVYCSRHEFREINGEYRKFKDGKDVTESKDIGDQLSGLACGDKMKGYSEAKQRQAERDKEYREKHTNK